MSDPIPVQPPLAAKTKWYEESQGVISSKRVFGAGLLVTGLAMKIGLFFFAVFGTINDATTASGQADSLIYAGGALLGLTVVDNVRLRIKPPEAQP